MSRIDWAQPSDYYVLPLDDWVDTFINDWLVTNFRPLFQALQWPVNQVLNGFEAFLMAIPFIVFLAALTALAWRTAGLGVAVFTAVSLLLIDLMDVWSQAMTTLAMIFTSVTFCAAVGIPLGIVAARSDRFAFVLRPILDVMQSIPAFVYLVPIVMLFGVGMVPGVIATIIFALPPMVRLTNLGIRQVRGELVEAAYAFGSTPWQVLWEIQLPLALRAIMAGLNQTLMLSLSMAVIAALIGAGGLGLTVFVAIGRLDVGLASLGGIGIILLAIILDRITQAVGESSGGGRPRPLARLRSFVPAARRDGATSAAEYQGADRR